MSKLVEEPWKHMYVKNKFTKKGYIWVYEEFNNMSDDVIIL